MATVYLVCGNTGAGKSSYSNVLARGCGGVCFSIDLWMQSLYGADYDPAVHDFSWITERTARCEARIRTTAAALLAAGVDVVLDFGFGWKRMRDQHRAWAQSLGVHHQLHYLDVPVEERKRRVRQRNRELGETFAFPVTDEMFDYVEPLFEPPERWELEGAVLPDCGGEHPGTE